MHIDIRNRKDQLVIAAAGTGLLFAGFIALKLARQRKPRSGPFKPETLPKDAYDAVIVGAGKIYTKSIVQGRLPVIDVIPQLLTGRSLGRASVSAT